jgi:hypothetical protein
MSLDQNPDNHGNGYNIPYETCVRDSSPGSSLPSPAIGAFACCALASLVEADYKTSVLNWNTVWGMLEIGGHTEQVSVKLFMAFVLAFALAFAAGLYFVEILPHSGR